MTVAEAAVQSGPDCQFDGSCSVSTTLTNWVNHDTFLTCLTYVGIAVVVTVLIYTTYRLWEYFHRPLCVDCLSQKNKKRTRTNQTYNVTEFNSVPVCEGHWWDRRINDEQRHHCPRHPEEHECEVQRYRDHVRHRCVKYGCTFFFGDEFDRLISDIDDDDDDSTINTVLIAAAAFEIGQASSSGC